CTGLPPSFGGVLLFDTKKSAAQSGALSGWCLSRCRSLTLLRSCLHNFCVRRHGADSRLSRRIEVGFGGIECLLRRLAEGVVSGVACRDGVLEQRNKRLGAGRSIARREFHELRGL